jgi:hypothetical protein
LDRFIGIFFKILIGVTQTIKEKKIPIKLKKDEKIFKTN